MVGGEGRTLGIRCEETGGICKSSSQYGLCQTENVSLSGLAVCTARNHQCWDHICATGGDIEI